MFTVTPLRKLTNLLPSSATLTRLAKTAGFIKRAPRKIFADELFRAVLLSLGGNEPHTRGIAEKISSQQQYHPTRQAVHKRLRTEEAAQFFYLAFKEVFTSQFKRFKSKVLDTGTDQFKGAFRRILIEDSTVLPLHKSLVDSFKGATNQHGEYAALRLRWVFDFLTGQTIDAQLHLWKENDLSTAYELIGMVKKGDLILRDMGYFCLECFHEIKKRGADFITRIPDGTVISSLSGERINVIDWLKKTPLDRVALDVEVGLQNSMEGRLIAIRLDKKKTAECRKKLRKKCKDAGKVPTKNQLMMCQWVVVFTDIPESKMDDASVAQLYRARWMVELFFKGMKSGQDLEKWSRHRTNQYTIQCLAYAQMIMGMISLELWRWMGDLLAERSRSKLKKSASCSDVANQRPDCIGPQQAFEQLKEVFEKIVRTRLIGRTLAAELSRRLKYVTQEKRQRQPLDELIFNLLSLR